MGIGMGNLPVNPIEERVNKALVPDLWNLTAAYYSSLPELMLQTKGKLEPMPAFLRVGYDEMLKRPVLRLCNEEVSSALLRLFDAHMPHLREVDLTGATLDKNKQIVRVFVQEQFPKHPDVKVIISPLGQATVLALLQKIGERDKATKEKQVALQATRQQLLVAPPGFFDRARQRLFGTTPAEPHVRHARRIAKIDEDLQRITDDLHQSDVVRHELRGESSTESIWLKFFPLLDAMYPHLDNLAKLWIALASEPSTTAEKEEAKTGFRTLLRFNSEIERLRPELERAQNDQDGTGKRMLELLEPLMNATRERHLASMSARLQEQEMLLNNAVRAGRISEAVKARIVAVLAQRPCSPAMMQWLREYGITEAP